MTPEPCVWFPTSTATTPRNLHDETLSFDLRTRTLHLMDGACAFPSSPVRPRARFRDRCAREGVCPRKGAGSDVRVDSDGARHHRSARVRNGAECGTVRGSLGRYRRPV